MSRFTSTRSPCFIAKLREVAALCAMIRTKQEKAMPSTLGTSPHEMPAGSPIGGKPPLTEPTTATPCEDASVTAETMMSRTTATMAPGTLGRNRLNATMMAIVAAPNANVVHEMSDSDVIQCHCCSNQLPRSLRDSQQVGDLAGEHLDADSGEEADQHRGGQEVTQEPEPQQPSDEQHAAADDRDQAAERDPLR